MSPETMWSILIAMGAITIGAVLKAVESARKLHLSDKELSSCMEQLDALKKQHAQSIAETQKLNPAKKDAFLKPINYPPSGVV